MNKKLKELQSVEYHVDKLVSRDESVVNENANKDSKVFAVKRDLIAGQVSKAYALKMLPEEVALAHINGDIHFHDLDYSPFTEYHNCCVIDVDYMQKNGFTMGNADVTRPKSIQVAVAQIVQIINSVTSSQYGGCSIHEIDRVLEEYARMNYDKHIEDAIKYNIPNKKEYAEDKTIRDIHDACESMEYELNTLYTSNGQSPFVSISYGRTTSWFGREIQKAILHTRLKGLGKDRKTAIFPKQLFFIEKGVNFNKEDINYDIKQLALKCSSRRIYPDILNVETLKKITGHVVTPMGCRSFLPAWTNEDGELVSTGRGNAGVVTLNLPRVAMESNGDFNMFWDILDERIDLVHKALEVRKNSVLSVKPYNAPILYQQGVFGKKLSNEDNVSSVFLGKRATISFGYIGLYETASVFYGGEWETNPKAKQFTLDILNHIHEKCDEWTEQEDIGFSIYSTPSESLTDRFCRLDTEKFGIVENITDKGYYTNSFHYDVRKNPTPFEKMEFEKDYPYIASGGFINYVEVTDTKNNLKALETVWDYSYDKIGYLGVNSPIDHCYECGYEGDFESTEYGYKCPNCGNSNPDKADVVKRLCGYLGQPLMRPEVAGRHKEISSRVKHQ